MIRINLLPQAKKPVRSAAAPGASQIWAIAYFVTTALWIVVLVVVYFMYDGKLQEQNQRNRALSTEIDQVKAESEGLDDARAELQQSRQLEELVQELDRARLGPARMMIELSSILSVEGGPTIDPQALEQLRRDNPLAGFNRSWDPRRLWLTSFEEEGRNCVIHGMGRTNEDVAEFLRRLSLSELFENVTLQKTESRDDAETELTFIGFELSCRVRY